MGKHTTVERSCERCGNTFYGTKWARFCYDCRAARNREKSREQKKRYRQRKLAEQQPAERKPTLSEIAALAREAGMNYGEYVSKHGC